MQQTTLTLQGETLRLYRCDTVVVGSGAAGFSAADRLYEQGRRDVVVGSGHFEYIVGKLLLQVTVAYGAVGISVAVLLHHLRPGSQLQ